MPEGAKAEPCEGEAGKLEHASEQREENRKVGAGRTTTAKARRARIGDYAAILGIALRHQPPATSVLSLPAPEGCDPAPSSGQSSHPDVRLDLCRPSTCPPFGLQTRTDGDRKLNLCPPVTTAPS